MRMLLRDTLLRTLLCEDALLRTLLCEDVGWAIRCCGRCCVRMLLLRETVLRTVLLRGVEVAD